MNILASPGAVRVSVAEFNANQVDFFLFKDTGLGGVLSKFIGKMNDPDIGGSRTSSCQIQSAHGTSPSMMTTSPTSRLLIVMASLPPDCFAKHSSDNHVHCRFRSGS